MSSSPTRDALATVLDTLASRLATLEIAMQSFGGTHPTPVAHVAHTNVPSEFYERPTKKKGKGKAKAAAPPPPTHAPHCQYSSSAPAAKAKGKQPTKPAAMRPTPTFHQAQVFPKEGQADRMLVTVVIPATSAAHVIGKGGKGLKQISDIAGARVSAYEVATSPDERHISLRGTDIQIGDALSVLGKRISRKRVHYPKKKATKAPAASSTTAPPQTAPAKRKLPASTKSTTVPPVYIPTDRASTSGLKEVPTTKDESAPSEDDHADPQPSVPSVQMASPSPSTPVVPSVAMGSPLPPLTPAETWSEMEIDQVIFHSRDSRDHDAVGLELRRAIAARLVKDGQVYHPSRLNPRAGLKPRGGNQPPRARGRRK